MTSSAAKLSDDDQQLERQERELEERQRRDLRSLRTKVLVASGVGVGGLLLYATQSPEHFAEVFAAGLLVSGAAALTGTLLGFLFGIPRTQSMESNASPSGLLNPPPFPGVQDAEGAFPGYAVNTNLEQISDWLTKILVGVGLTQLNQAPDALRRLSDWLGQSIPGHPEMGRFALGAIAYSSTFGFLFGYIWTRVVLSPLFRRADEQLRKAIVRRRLAEQSATSTIAMAAQTANATLTAASAEAESMVRSAKERANRLAKVERDILACLYERPEQQGYRRAIRMAEDYLVEDPEPRSYWFWLWYAAAQGQRASAEPEAFDDARKKALDSAAKTVAIGGTMGRYWLSTLLHPNHPHKTQGDNDLEVFANDAAFRQLIGDEPFVPESSQKT